MELRLWRQSLPEFKIYQIYCIVFKFITQKLIKILSLMQIWFYFMDERFRGIYYCHKSLKCDALSLWILGPS